MPVLLNHTPFAVLLFSTLDPQGEVLDVVVVSAAFLIPPSGSPSPWPEPLSVHQVDEYWGEPAESSPRYESEIAWRKPFVDLIINGTARVPRGRRAERLPVRLRAADIDKTLVVTGDRYWGEGAAGLVPSAPQPFVVMPIVYERAFGGSGLSSRGSEVYETRNPVGVGFKGVRSRDANVRTMVPNIEYQNGQLRHQDDLVAPAGFGIVARHWQPRRGWAGTYDAAWQTEHCPLLPLDFNLRHFQSAPEDQQSAHIRGGEIVELHNMTPEGIWRFALPVLEVPLAVWSGRRKAEGQFRLDTVLIEPDLYRVTLIARATPFSGQGRRPADLVVVGYPSRAWERARAKRLAYLDWHGSAGAMTNPPALFR